MGTEPAGLDAQPPLFPVGSRTKLNNHVHVGWRDLNTQRFLSLSQLADTQHRDKVPVFVRANAGWKLG